MNTTTAFADDLVTGRFDYIPRGFGFIRTGIVRTPRRSTEPGGSEIVYAASDDDIYVSPAQIRRHGLEETRRFLMQMLGQVEEMKKRQGGGPVKRQRRRSAE